MFGADGMNQGHGPPPPNPFHYDSFFGGHSHHGHHDFKFTFDDMFKDMFPEDDDPFFGTFFSDHSHSEEMRPR